MKRLPNRTADSVLLITGLAGFGLVIFSTVDVGAGSTASPILDFVPFIGGILLFVGSIVAWFARDRRRHASMCDPIISPHSQGPH